MTRANCYQKKVIKLINDKSYTQKNIIISAPFNTKNKGIHLQKLILLSIKCLEDKNLYANFARRKDTDLVVSIRSG